MTAKTNIKKIVCMLVCLVIVAAIFTAFSSCKKDDTGDTVNTVITASEKKITVTVTDENDKDTEFVIETKEEFLRGALEQINLVSGEEGEFGLYVKVVNGITADYDSDGAYWTFYKGEEYLMTGIDETPISDGDSFRIVYTKG